MIKSIFEDNNICLTEEEHYEKISEEVLNEGFFKNILSKMFSIFGFSSAVALAGFGTALLINSAASKEGKIRNFFGRIFKKKGKESKDIFSYDSLNKNKNKISTQKELSNYDSWKTKLDDIYKSIEQKDIDSAKAKFETSEYANNSEAKKALAIKITETYGEPPLYVYPSGNESYFACKKLFGIQYAKALTLAVISAVGKNKSYYSDIQID